MPAVNPKAFQSQQINQKLSGKIATLSTAGNNAIGILAQSIGG